MVNLYNMTQKELCDLAVQLEEKPYRGKQIFTWLYRGVSSFDDMTDLSKAFREKLEAEACLKLPEIAIKQVSKDGTKKYSRNS